MFAAVTLSLLLAAAGDAGADEAAEAAVCAADAGSSESIGLEGSEADDFAEVLQVPRRAAAPPIATVKSLPFEKDLVAQAAPLPDGGWVARVGEAEEPLTIDPALQKSLTDVLKSYQTPYGAVVVMEPATGRVRAMAEHSERVPGLRGLCTKAIYPAASIFKIVTGAALLEAGVKPSETTCFHGGKRKLTEQLLKDSPADGRCLSLAQAMGQSANVVFAKMTLKHLTPGKLREMARRLHFNREFAFEVPTEPSLVAVPDDEIGLASTGAGFGDTYLSPLHGAALASVAANGGLWRAPVLLERDVVESGSGERVLSEEAARDLTDMLEQTVTAGTARYVFNQRGFRVEGAVGKTGSLADKKPFRDYTWFVGFAPRSAPKVAVAAVIVNDPYWRIRASWLGREALRLSLEARRDKGPRPRAGPGR